jgi:hypothetical protein
VALSEGADHRKAALQALDEVAIFERVLTIGHVGS